jgi:hypothetical protein
MIIIPLLVNAIVICVLTAALVATALGIASADQLLISSALSGLLTILSFKLSKEALLQINAEQGAPVSPDEKASDEA